MKQLILEVVAIAVISATGCQVLIAAETSFPLLEDYKVKESPSQFGVAVKKFIMEHPESKFIPRLAYDLYIAASANGDANLIKEAKALLLTRGDLALQAEHLLSSVQDADTMRILITDLNQSIDTSNKKNALRLCELTKTGLQRYGRSLIDDQISFLILIYINADSCGDDALVRFCTDEIKKYAEEGSNHIQLVNIVFSDKITLEKYVSLGNLRSEEAGFVRQLYFDYLSESDKAKPEVILIQIERLFGQGNHEEAVNSLSKLPGKIKNNKNLFVLKGQALFAMKKKDEAIAALKYAIELTEKKTERDTINTLIEAIHNIENNQSYFTTVIPKFASTFLGGDLVFELDMKIKKDEEDKLDNSSVYIGLNLSDKNIDIQVRKSGVLEFGYKTKNNQTSLYLSGEDKILEYEGVSLYPSPSLSIDRLEDGGFHFKMGFNLESNISEISNNTSKLFGSPYLSTSYGVGKLLDYTIRKKVIFPFAPEKVKDYTIYQMGSFGWKDLEWTIMGVGIDSEDTIRHLNINSDVAIDNILFGANSEAKLSPPDWPDIPIKSKGTFSQSDLVEIMGFFMKMISSLSEGVTESQ